MTSQTQKALVVYTLYFSLISSACSSGFISTLSDLTKLQKQLIEKYHERDVRVNLQNSSYLSIGFVNSPLNQGDSGARELRAEETARFVAANYSGIKKIQNITVAFVEAKSRFIFVHYSRSLDLFVFDNKGVPVPRDYAEEENPRKPIARYNRARQETDISITRLQLEGDLNEGIVLVPHFTASGDVRAGDHRLQAPTSVTFDFACYSSEKRFRGDSQLEIRADDQSAFAGSARLLSAADTGASDNIAQFLTAQIPYGQFARIANAHTVKIILGKKKLEMSSEGIGALHDMVVYVRQPTE